MRTLTNTEIHLISGADPADALIVLGFSLFVGLGTGLGVASLFFAAESFAMQSAVIGLTTMSVMILGCCV